MYCSKGQSVHAIIEQGLEIFSAEGAARAWVFMTSSAIAPSVVAEKLAMAAKQRSVSRLSRSTNAASLTGDIN